MHFQSLKNTHTFWYNTKFQWGTVAIYNWTWTDTQYVTIDQCQKKYVVNYRRRYGSIRKWTLQSNTYFTHQKLVSVLKVSNYDASTFNNYHAAICRYKTSCTNKSTRLRHSNEAKNLLRKTWLWHSNQADHGSPCQQKLNSRSYDLSNSIIENLLIITMNFRGA